jgi:hypothetical protein
MLLLFSNRYTSATLKQSLHVIGICAAVILEQIFFLSDTQEKLTSYRHIYVAVILWHSSKAYKLLGICVAVILEQITFFSDTRAKLTSYSHICCCYSRTDIFLL